MSLPDKKQRVLDHWFSGMFAGSARRLVLKDDAVQK